MLRFKNKTSMLFCGLFFYALNCSYAFSSEDILMNKAYVLSNDENVSFVLKVDLENGQILDTKKFERVISSITTDPDGKYLYMTCVDGKKTSILIYDWKYYTKIDEIILFKYYSSKNQYPSDLKGLIKNLTVSNRKIYISSWMGQFIYDLDLRKLKNMNGYYWNKIDFIKENKFSYTTQEGGEDPYSENVINAKIIKINFDNKMESTVWHLQHFDRISNISISPDDKFGYYILDNEDSFSLKKFSFDEGQEISSFNIELEHNSTTVPIIKLSTNGQFAYVFKNVYCSTKELFKIDLTKEKIINRYEYKNPIDDVSAIFIKDELSFQKLILKKQKGGIFADLIFEFNSF